MDLGATSQEKVDAWFESGCFGWIGEEEDAG